MARSLRLALIIAATAGIALPLSVAASAIHQYAVGYETTGGSGFTGVRTTRLDVTMTGLPNTGCSSPFSGSPVYQTQWVILTGSNNWHELGTGHQCQGTYNYWFWGYGAAGVWHPLGTQGGIALGVSHTFKTWRTNVEGHETYYFDVDSVTKGSRVTSASGTEVEAGLESYWTPVNAIYTTSSLAYQKNDGGFVSWAGRDSTTVGPLMCGSWVSDTSWSSGEGSPCN